jgi:hypothetical protein
VSFTQKAETRNRLEEQEREIINRQRRAIKRAVHREEGLGPERAGQFGFHDPDDPFWHDDKMGEKEKTQLESEWC